MLAGLQKTTLINFPRRVAAAVFLPGCNMRCPYCHNAELATASVSGINLSADNKYLPIEDIYAFLEKRCSLISGLVISGGEPFMSPALEGLIAKAKTLTLKVKIDTNGFFPKRLSKVLESKDLQPDMIAIDVKTALNRYGELFPTMPKERLSSFQKAFLETLSILNKKKGDIEVEYRTVLAPPLVTETEIREIASLLPSQACWRLARFVPGHCLKKEWNMVKPYPESEAESLAAIAASLIQDTKLR